MITPIFLIQFALTTTKNPLPEISPVIDLLSPFGYSEMGFVIPVHLRQARYRSLTLLTDFLVESFANPNLLADFGEKFVVDG